jgi:outer membrane protein assembly factor BamB
VIANGVVYYADGMGQTVHAFDAATGTELWHSQPGDVTGDAFDSPLVFDGKIYVSSRDGAVHAFG